MQVTSVGAFIKIILGVVIGYILFNYVNVLEHQALGVGFGFLAVLLVIRGSSYFVFLSIRSLLSSLPREKVISTSYRLSLLLAVYTLINIALMIADKWNVLIGILIALLFLVVQYSATLELRKANKE